MRAWRPDQSVLGPHAAVDDDVDRLNYLFSESFTDRYRRDGMGGVRVPRLNPQIWRYALRDAGHGAMLWQDDNGNLVAFNIAHNSGVEGWMGPLAVRPDRQGQGVGRLVVHAAIEWLRERDVRTIGLETMPRTVDNIGFYGGMGFLPEHLTVTMVANCRSRRQKVDVTKLSRLGELDREDMIAACRARLDRSAPGLDFTREVLLTQELGIGDTVIVSAGQVEGFALWHSAPLVEGRSADELRLLKLFADSAETFELLISALEDCAVGFGIRNVAVRCQTASEVAYTTLMRRGYRVRWTDLRMTLSGYPETAIPEGEVLLSNWEI